MCIITCNNSSSKISRNGTVFEIQKNYGNYSYFTREGLFHNKLTLNTQGIEDDKHT
jgi:hypothetical protein